MLTSILVPFILIVLTIGFHALTFMWLYGLNFEGSYPEFLISDIGCIVFLTILGICSIIPLLNIVVLALFIVSLIELWCMILWRKYRYGMSKEEISKSIP